ncbi:hypothetical protein [Desulfosarcina widdelii]|uniref:hypothetical protein n=1 Tax=Desulfosarcina widdelii TaxID=947919 RepID=UPI0012D31C16|nr:hypothetical protein [Desulfosarcina widdelii]
MSLTATIAILRFFMSPEDTSAGHSKGLPIIEPVAWRSAKAVLWIAAGVFAGVAIGQL